MDLSESELRALVREAIRAQAHAPETPVESSRAHASHALMPLVPSGDADGACLIEPAVRCNHCGYCLSYGH